MTGLDIRICGQLSQTDARSSSVRLKHFHSLKMNLRSPIIAPRTASSDALFRSYALSEPSALAGLRVLDLTDLKGHLCARLLADMGADVIKIEPPGGDGARNVGPFVDNRPHSDRSLFFWFYNLNKRSMTLDLRHPEGAALLRRLAEGADVVIESFKPGEMARMGLGWEVLHALNPALVLCSIAPFGQSGPYSGYAADDSVLTALSGMLYVNGFPDSAPVRPFAFQPLPTRRHTTARSPPCARCWPATARAKIRGKVGGQVRGKVIARVSGST